EAAAKIASKVASAAKVQGMENAAACAATDILVLTVPFEGHAALLKELKPHIRVGALVIPAVFALRVSMGFCPTRTSERWRSATTWLAPEPGPVAVAAIAAAQN